MYLMTTTGTNVLVVDDHADTAKMLARALRRRGIETESVQDGADALELMQTMRPQVVIMDEMMPGLNGLEVVRRMRNMPELSDVKVLFYSAAYDWLSQREARDLGAVDWVVKGTIHIDQVAKRVADLCGGIE
jgi:CheY-like chemotaxis protein